MESSYQLEPIANYHCEIGENPLWDDLRKQLFWNDIPRGKIFYYDPKTGKHGEYYSGGILGGFTFQMDGSLLLFEEEAISRLGPDGHKKELLRIPDSGATRFNDVIADPEGRVYAGTIGRTAESGGLYRIERDGHYTKLFGGTQCPNGMCFTPDLKYFFWTCSTVRKIFRFDYNQKSGEISNRKEWAAVPEEGGLPDGMAMDVEGYIWSGRWDGWEIVRHAPDGSVADRIRFPVEKVTSVMYGGDDLKDLYVTTAGGKEGSSTLDGMLYRIRMTVPGVPEYRSRILC